MGHLQPSTKSLIVEFQGCQDPPMISLAKFWGQLSVQDHFWGALARAKKRSLVHTFGDFKRRHANWSRSRQDKSRSFMNITKTRFKEHADHESLETKYT